MKTITMYELLGLVKDGKAPKKIKFNSIYCYYKEYRNEYVDFINNPIIQWDYVVMNCLNDEVEIIEEEKEIPEKLKTYKEVDDEKHFANILKVSKNGECEIDEATSVIADKINEIIDYLDYLNSKGE